MNGYPCYLHITYLHLTDFWLMFPAMLTQGHQEILTKKQLILDIFSMEIGWINSDLPTQALAMWQHGFLSIFIAFYEIFCSGMEKKSTLVFLLQLWAYWDNFQFKNSRESIIVTRNTYHGVVFSVASHADVLRLVTRSSPWTIDKPKNVCVGG